MNKVPVQWSLVFGGTVVYATYVIGNEGPASIRLDSREKERRKRVIRITTELEES